MTEPRLIMAQVAHGDRQAVAAELHVLVLPSEDGGYFAQGLEIDYVATGATEEEARARFASGFIRTVRSYLQRGRDLGALFSKSKTPDQYWKAYYEGAKQHIFGCAIVHDVSDEVPESAPIPSVLRFCRPANALA